MAVAEHAMNRIPTAIAFPRYGLIVSCLSALRADSRNCVFAFASGTGLGAISTADCCCITVLPASDSTPAQPHGVRQSDVADSRFVQIGSAGKCYESCTRTDLMPVARQPGQHRFTASTASAWLELQIRSPRFPDQRRRTGILAAWRMLLSARRGPGRSSSQPIGGSEFLRSWSPPAVGVYGRRLLLDASILSAKCLAFRKPTRGSLFARTTPVRGRGRSYADGSRRRTTMAFAPTSRTTTTRCSPTEEWSSWWSWPKADPFALSSSS